MKYKISENNFDLIRLFAASEVAVLHVMSYLSTDDYWKAPPLGKAIINLFEMFPGVPIFFFISGFLISRSFERAGSVREYARNRGLRIFPALHVCLAVNLLMIWATGYFAIVGARVPDVLLLFLAKASFFQFYNPEFMRKFGDGVLNGSLWTVCVELQFYFLIPILYRLLPLKSARKTIFALVALIVISIVCNRLMYVYQAEYGASNYWKLVRVSFLPWFYMFLVGVLVQRNFEYLSSLLRPRLLAVLLPAYIAYGYLMIHLGYSYHNDVSPLLFFPLVATILVCAFTGPTLSKRLLRGNDFSYGIYIYHVPFMNMLLYYGYQGKLTYTAIVIGITLVAAGISWFAIERPSLSRKHRSIHPVAATP